MEVKRDKQKCANKTNIETDGYGRYRGLRWKTEKEGNNDNWN